MKLIDYAYYEEGPKYALPCTCMNCSTRWVGRYEWGEEPPLFEVCPHCGVCRAPSRGTAEEAERLTATECTDPEPPPSR